MRAKSFVACIIVAISIVFIGCGSKTPIEFADHESSTEYISIESSSKEKEDKKFTPGVIKNNTYENAFFNVKISIPDDMSFFDNSKLAELNNVAEEYMDNETVKKAMEISRSSIVAYAANDDGTTFNISLSEAGKMTTTVFNERAVIEGSKDMTEKEFEKIGYSDIQAEMEVTTFLGEEHYALVINGKNSEGEYYVKACALLKDGYIATFTVGSNSEDDFAILDEAQKLTYN